MKNSLFIVLLTMFSSCQFSTQENTDNKENLSASDTTDKDREVIEPISIDTVLIGDMNNDGIQDTAFILTPPVIKHLDNNDSLQFYSDCVNGDCYNGKDWNIAGRVDYYRCNEDVLATHVRKVKGKYFLFGTTNEDGEEKEDRVALKMK